MSFLDNLENNLKALEGREEKGGEADDRRRRETERERAIAAAPYAERLRSGPFADALLTEAMRAAHAARTPVQPIWLGTTLRLQARDRKLEFRPTPEGIVAVFLDGNTETRTVPVDLEASAAHLLRELLQKD